MSPERRLARQRAALLLLAVGFGGFGAAYAFRPLSMAALTEIALPTPTARIDFAATYGGSQLGLAAFLTLCATRPPWVSTGLLAAAWTLAGIVSVRLGSLVLSGVGASPVIYGGLAIETVGLLLALRAAR